MVTANAIVVYTGKIAAINRNSFLFHGPESTPRVGVGSMSWDRFPLSVPGDVILTGPRLGPVTETTASLGFDETSFFVTYSVANDTTGAAYLEASLVIGKDSYVNLIGKTTNITFIIGLTFATQKINFWDAAAPWSLDIDWSSFLDGVVVLSTNYLIYGAYSRSLVITAWGVLRRNLPSWRTRVVAKFGWLTDDGVGTSIDVRMSLNLTAHSWVDRVQAVEHDFDLLCDSETLLSSVA